MPSEQQKTCVCYCRTSTSKQKDSASIETQVETCAHLVERHNLNYIRYGTGPAEETDGYGWLRRDSGISGSLLEGRQFKIFLEDLKMGKIHPDYLVLYSLSRISRVDRSSEDPEKLIQSGIDAAEIRATLQAYHVKVIDQDGIIDPKNLEFELKSMFSNEEYKQIRGRTSDGKKRHLAQGNYAKGGHAPYGYKVVRGEKRACSIVPDPEKASNLRRIVCWYVEGGYYFAARKATEAEIPTPMRETDGRKKKAKDWTPTRWSPVSIQHIIRNIRAYLGETTYRYAKKPYLFNYAPILDLETVVKVESRQKERTLKRRADFLTTGFVDCSCQAHIHQKNSHGEHYTRCPKGCGSMPQAKFESYLWIATSCRLVQIRKHEGLRVPGKTWESEIQAAQDELDKADTSLNRLLDLYLNAELDRSIWEQRNRSLNDTKTKVLASLVRIKRAHEDEANRQATESALEREIRGILDELAGSPPTLERKREVLGQLLHGKRVVVTFLPPLEVTRKDGNRSRKSQTSPSVTFLFPAFGGLPEASVSTSEDIWNQLLGERVYDQHYSSLYVGLGAQAAEQALLERILSNDGQVLAREEMPDGSIHLRFRSPKDPM